MTNFFESMSTDEQAKFAKAAERYLLLIPGAKPLSDELPDHEILSQIVLWQQSRNRDPREPR